jgi:hypothetical protein
LQLIGEARQLMATLFKIWHGRAIDGTVRLVGVLLLLVETTTTPLAGLVHELTHSALPHRRPVGYVQLCSNDGSLMCGCRLCARLHVLVLLAKKPRKCKPKKKTRKKKKTWSGLPIIQ